jgi:hypothetical protein
MTAMATLGERAERTPLYPHALAAHRAAVASCRRISRLAIGGGRWRALVRFHDQMRHFLDPAATVIISPDGSDSLSSQSTVMDTRPMTIHSAAATLKPTPYAKRMMALGHLRKGRHFIGAAMLLREKGGDEYVVLHLLCQGIEIVLKAVLLLRDFDRYQPRLVRYGHNLLDLASDALAEYNLHPLRAPVLDELKELDRLYSHHILRYSLLLHSLN